MSTNQAPAWDLSELYAGLDDPALEADCAALLEAAMQFEERFRGRIAAPECSAETLSAAMDAYESILRQRARPVVYSSLLFSADTTDPARGALLQKMQSHGTSVNRHLIFFDLEVGKMPEETFRRIIEQPVLARYRHALEHERLVAKHHLSEPEEKVADELGNTGSRAFTRLFNEITSRAVYRVAIDGEVKELTQSQTLALLYDADREHRRAAAEGFTAVLREQSHVLSFVFNTLIQDKATVDRLRGYDYPEQARHEGNEIEPEVVCNVVEVTRDAYGIVAEYYSLKRRILGLNALTHYDRYAPLSAHETRIPFPEARETVLSAFNQFSPAMSDIAGRFFERGWIDAEVRPGKSGGAYCNSVTPQHHPYVFMNYTDRPRDVMTLAHELGHAIHAMLAGKHHYLDFHATLPLAETASVFAEMLVFDRLRERMEDRRERLSLLGEKIEDTFATVFRQVTMYRFEQEAHRARREEGELPVERYNALWQSTMQEMFGDSLCLGDDHGWWWLHIPHIYAAPFYVYAYAFGELLVLALYARYKREGEPFVRHYLDLLASGGSRLPADLLADIGIDIARREFWQGGIDLIAEMVAHAKELADGLV